MNRVTKEITTSLIGFLQKGMKKEVEVPGYEDLKINLKNVSIQRLVALNRQYLTYSKMHQPAIEDVPQLYVQFLKSHLG